MNLKAQELDQDIYNLNLDYNELINRDGITCGQELELEEENYKFVFDGKRNF